MIIVVDINWLSFFDFCQNQVIFFKEISDFFNNMLNVKGLNTPTRRMNPNVKLTHESN